MADSNEWRAKNKERARASQNRYNAENRQQVRENKQEWYQKHKKQQREYANDYYKENAKAAKARVNAYRRANPEKARAQRKVQEAVKRGELIRPVICSECGNQGRTDAHHADYSKPLEVVWLCRKCHRARHRAPVV